MAILRLPDENRSIHEQEVIAAFLSDFGIDYERWNPDRNIASGTPAQEVLEAYAPEIEALKAKGGYTTADIIDVNPETPQLDAMLAKFQVEHWHDEDEVRFIISGRGLFHIRPKHGPVMALEVEAGDLVSVPRGTWHWFDLCRERQIWAIRLFQDPAGWTPNYTGSGVDAGYEPVCLGPQYIPLQETAE